MQNDQDQLLAHAEALEPAHLGLASCGFTDSEMAQLRQIPQKCDSFIHLPVLAAFSEFGFRLIHSQLFILHSRPPLAPLL